MQHLGELHLLQQLKHHPARVFDQDKAPLHFTGIMPLVSQMCHDGDHDERMEAAARALRHEFAGLEDSDPRVYVVISSYWDLQTALGPLADLMTTPIGRKRLLIGTSDIKWATPLHDLPSSMHIPHDSSWRAYHRHDLRPNWFSVPYVASYLLDQAARRPEETCQASDRKKSFMFAGSFGRSGRGRYRATVLSAMSEAATNEEVVKSDGKEHRTSHETVRQYAARQLRARFCLVPLGDSATSRRLFDAMAAGCEPVFLGEGQGEGLEPQPNAAPVCGASLACSFAICSKHLLLIPQFGSGRRLHLQPGIRRPGQWSVQLTLSPLDRLGKSRPVCRPPPLLEHIGRRRCQEARVMARDDRQ